MLLLSLLLAVFSLPSTITFRIYHGSVVQPQSGQFQHHVQITYHKKV